MGMYVCFCVRSGEEVSSGKRFGKGSLNLEPFHTVIGLSVAVCITKIYYKTDF